MRRFFNSLHFKQIDYGIKTVLTGLIPVIFVLFVFQFWIDTTPYGRQLRLITIDQDYNFKMLLYYLMFGCLHIIVCGIISYHLISATCKDTTAPVRRSVKFISSAFLIFTFLLVYFLDSFHTNLAYFSHERLYVIMSRSTYFKMSFRSFPIDFFPGIFNGRWFYIFSIFPFVLICSALSNMVFGGFYIGKEMYRYIPRENIAVEEIKKYMADINKTLKQYVQLLSVVLVSSTIATVLFFQVPVLLIKDPLIRDAYSSISIAMGICWGIIFTLTLLFLVIVPYRITYLKITEVIQEIRIVNDEKLESWIEKNKSYYSLLGNMKLIASIMAPAAAGIATTLLSHVSF